MRACVCVSTPREVAYGEALKNKTQSTTALQCYNKNSTSTTTTEKKPIPTELKQPPKSELLGDLLVP